MDKIKVKIKKLHPDAIIPKYQTEGSAGFDLHSIEDIDFMFRKFSTTGQKVRTGLAFEIPEGYELQIRPRSGLSVNSNIRISNSPGTIDSDYVNEVCIIVDLILNNTVLTDTKINKGDRIAQAVLCPVFRAEFEEVETLKETTRNGGFGSTGV